MNRALDASVLAASARIEEAAHAASDQFLDQAPRRGVGMFSPVILLPECVAAVARATGDTTKAAKMLADIRRLASLCLVAVEDLLATRAAWIAMTCRLRGADSVYVAVAEAFDATLITWDTEVLARAPAVVPTMTPADWLAQHATQT